MSGPARRCGHGSSAACLTAADRKSFRGAHARRKGPARAAASAIAHQRLLDDEPMGVPAARHGPAILRGPRPDVESRFGHRVSRMPVTMIEARTSSR
jgi:hypothetical protein